MAGIERTMRITWLLEVADQLWGGVVVALENANWLQQRGHRVTVVSRSGAPTWMQLACEFKRVPDFHAANLPDADVLIGTFWTTVPWAASAGAQKGVPVHFCQGYEGDNPENAPVRQRIEGAYRLPGLRHVTISPHLTRLLHDRFGITAHEVVYAIDHDVHFPGPGSGTAARSPHTPLRVGLVGPYEVPWKDLATGYEACRRAHAAGQQLVLVRATNVPPVAAEQNQPFPVEWHQQVPPARMGEFYRSLDLLLATSSGTEEGFFLPAIEAMACGVPVVATDVPCFRNHEALAGHDRYALFVPPRDAAAMAEALVLAGSLPDVRRSLRDAGIELARHYHRDRHGEQLEATLQRLVAAPAERAPLRLVADEPAAAATASLPQFGASLRAAAARLQADGDAVQGARALTAAHCLAPDDLHLLHEAANAQVAAGAPATGLRLWDDAAARGVDDEALHVGRGHALHALGRLHEAAQAFRAALVVGPRHADAYNRLGVVLFQSGDLPGARRSFERALMLQPDHGDARANLQNLPAA